MKNMDTCDICKNVALPPKNWVLARIDAVDDIQEQNIYCNRHSAYYGICSCFEIRTKQMRWIVCYLIYWLIDDLIDWMIWLIGLIHNFTHRSNGMVQWRSFYSVLLCWTLNQLVCSLAYWAILPSMIFFYTTVTLYLLALGYLVPSVS